MLGFSLLCEETAVLSLPTPYPEHCLAGFLHGSPLSYPGTALHKYETKSTVGGWINPIYFPFPYLFLLKEQQNPSPYNRSSWSGSAFDLLLSSRS